MRTLPLILGLLLAPSLAAAKPCKKLAVDRTDAFGVRTHGGVVYQADRYRAVGLREEDGKLLLATLWVQSGVRDQPAPAGTEVQFALADGTLFTGRTLVEAPAVSNANLSTIFTQWVLDIELDRERLAQLTAVELVGVRVEFAELNMSYGPTAKLQADFRTLAACMME